jgi:type I restriction enzyme, S subunit
MNLRQAQLPKGWVYCQLEDAVTKDSSNISINKIKDEDGEYPVFAAKGFVQNVSFYHQEEEYLAIIKDGAGIGRVTKHPAKSSVVATMQYLIPKKGFDINFIKYFLEGVDFEKHRNGSTIPHIYFKDYKSEKFPKLPLPEQQRIVSILDECFEAIERSRNAAIKNLNNAKELFESYLQGVFENGDWVTKTIQEVTKVINGYAFASKDFKPTNTIKSIKITNVGVNEFVEEADNYLPEKFKDTLKEVQVREGNIVIALTRTIISAGLKVAVVPASYDGALVNQRVAALVPNEKIINQRYLYNYLTTDGVAKYVLAHVNTLMQPNLSINDLKNLPIPCPSINEQNEIVGKLDSLRNEVENLKSVYQQKINNLEELKKSILQKAFAGELRGVELVEPTTEKELII